VSRCLVQIKTILYGDATAGTEPNPEQVDQLVGELLSHNIIVLLIAELPKLEFEVRYQSSTSTHARERERERERESESPRT
jgi:hypothetical protein